MRYADFIDKYIFVPLDMKHTGYEGNKIKFKNKAIGYHLIKPKPEEGFKLDMSIAYSAGGLYSNIDDLYKWDQALYTEKLVKAETQKKMFTPDSQTNNNYGYG